MGPVQYDDDVLQQFGIPADQFAIRPKIQKSVDDALYQSTRNDAKRSIPEKRDLFHKCVVCTLPFGTCEHTEEWIQRHRQDILAVEERSRGLKPDDVDAQLSDLMGIISFAQSKKPPAPASAPPAGAVPRSRRHMESALSSSSVDHARGQRDDASGDASPTVPTSAPSTLAFEGLGDSTRQLTPHAALDPRADQDNEADTTSQEEDAHDATSTPRPTLDRGTMILEGQNGLKGSMAPWEISISVGATTAGLLPPPPLRDFRWTYPPSKPVDRINDTMVDLSSPGPRHGHTLVAVNPFVLVSFGGFTFIDPDTQAHHPFRSYTSVALESPTDAVSPVQFHNDVCVYDTVKESWGSVEASVVNGGAGPEGRYGHAAVMLTGTAGAEHGTDRTSIYGAGSGARRAATADDPDDSPAGSWVSMMSTVGGEMFMFGGRLRSGRCCQEAWILHWSPIQPRWEFLGPDPKSERDMDERMMAERDENRGLSSANMCLERRDWPPPRYDCASTVTSQGSCVVIHGGRSSTSGENLGDLWIWRRFSRRWEQPMIVGIPPAPRYGHTLLELPGTTGEVLILGGCTVSANQLIGTTAENDDLRIELALAHQRVLHAQAVEMAQAKLAAVSLLGLSRVNGQTNLWTQYRDLVRQGAIAAAMQANMETQTRREEEHLAQLQRQREILDYWAEIQACHGTHVVGLKGQRGKIHMDGVLVDLNTRTYAPLEAQGEPPEARMHGVVQQVAGRIMVFGGSRPRGKETPEYALADCALDQASSDGTSGPSRNNAARRQSTRAAQKTGAAEGTVETRGLTVHVLDTGEAYPLVGQRGMKTGKWRWVKVPAEDSPQWLEPAATAAETAVRRAAQVVEKAKADSQQHGCKGTTAVALYESEAHLDVCRWRARMLRREQRLLAHPPACRTCSASCTLGYRVFIHGGVVGPNLSAEMLAVDLELPDERQRRLREEFALRLEREVHERAVADAMERRERKFAHRLFKARERKREKKERALMHLEHILSMLPPTTTAPMPQCSMVSTNTIWLEWDAVNTDAAGKPIGGDCPVLYFLSMKPGYHAYEEGQRVRVQYSGKKTGTKMLASAQSSVHSDNLSLGDASSVVSGAIMSLASAPEEDDSAPVKQHGATVTKVHKDRFQGLFDVLYDDGGKEYKVPRHRIQPEEEQPWKLVYVGEETNYAVQGLVPDFVLYQDSAESKTAVECAFVLQTQFTEYHWSPALERPVRCDELSFMSAQVQFRTRQIREDEKRASHLGRRFKEAIELDNGVTVNVTGGVKFESTAGLSEKFI